MNKYPIWKYALIAIALVVSAIYAAPNLFGEVPVVQVSAGPGTVPSGFQQAGEQRLRPDPLAQGQRPARFRGVIIRRQPAGEQRRPVVGREGGRAEPGSDPAGEFRGGFALARPAVAGSRDRGEIGQRRPQDFLDGEPVFADNAFRLERFLEQPPGEVGQARQRILGGFVVPGGDRGAGPDAAQLPLGDIQPFLEPADEAGDIRPLRPVIGVQFVEHQIAQGAFAVIAPDGLVLRAHQQEVQHFVVGQQNIGRLVLQHLLVGNGPPGLLHCAVQLDGHLADGAFLGSVGIGGIEATGVEADANFGFPSGSGSPAQGRRPEDFIGKAPGLIGGQRVHGIEDDRLDTLPAGAVFAIAVIENRHLKTLGFTRAGAGGDQG